MQQHALHRTRQAVQQADGVRVLARPRSGRGLGLLRLHRGRKQRGLGGSLCAHKWPAWAGRSDIACNGALELLYEVQGAARS